MLMGGPILALLAGDYEKERKHSEEFFQTKPQIQQQHSYFLEACPGDEFVIDVKLEPNSSDVKMELLFMDKRLVGVLQHLDDAQQAYSSSATVDINNLRNHIDTLNACIKECDAYQTEINKQQVCMQIVCVLILLICYVPYQMR